MNRPATTFPSRCPTCGRRKKRTTDANARYWLLLHQIAVSVKAEGHEYSAETWHHYCKSRFLGCDDVTLPNGKTLTIPRSSADLSVDEFGAYMDEVEAWAASRDVWLGE